MEECAIINNLYSRHNGFYPVITVEDIEGVGHLADPLTICYDSVLHCISRLGEYM